ncbi:hypothetical protein jhhlp_002994 [Lomentospora prolificans]|uniref:UDENN FLCN/SMCR8-type domain-containing protein n=1 Tax=Lomentospora prolificans TaxID=41688 RepID=A0A2N3NFM5_9PEZI|nr:hypothetical protein jhhlp_002994 [Lomentospora prolificans]
MTSILCLAHYCDLHGPTPLMVTEGLPVTCSTCFDREAPFPDERPGSATSQPITPASSHSVAAITDALRNINFAPHRSSSVPASEEDAQAHRASLLRTGSSNAAAMAAALSSGSAIETPPASPSQTEPRKLPPPHVRRDSSFRKTYDEYVTKRAGPCDNCAMTLPTDSNLKQKSDVRGPTLRTKTPYAWVFGGTSGQDSPPNSQPSSASDTDGDGEGEFDEEPPLERKSLRRTATSSTTSRSSAFSNGTPGSHTHYIEYISTKEPVLPASFSIIRASCLRTLSFETLPRNPSAPGGAPQVPAVITAHSPGNAASGGPIFFGDPLAGYTTAYIFRIPDVHARGHKRIYAFLALSTHKERVAMKTFGFIAAAFRDMASWIQQLAEAEAEAASGGPRVGTATSSIQSSSLQQQANSQEGGSAFDRAAGGAFMSGGSAFARRIGGGAGGIALKARGLPELVGMPDFFVQLHVKFVQILRELGVKMNA